MIPIADRTVKVSLIANVNGYVAGMQRMSRETGKASDEAKKKLEAQGRAFGEIGAASMKMGVLVAAGIAIAVKKFADFDQAMSQVKAATQETAANMGLLREAALKAGADTQYSATEAANAIEELGKAGLTTSQIIGGGLSGALTLAAAGGIGVAEAAGYAAIAMKQFGLEGAALPHVADLFAAGAGKAVGDVSDLAQALGQAGLVANGAGQSIEDTTGVLAAFADAGLLGSDAGTSLKSAIIALQAPTEKSSKLMEKYNLDFYDGNGAMLSYSQIAGQLTTNLGSLTEEERNATLAKIFGNDALRSANVLYEQGAAGIQGYIDQTNDSGYAAQVAADRMDNLAGDIEKLGGAFDTALIKSGSGANETLRQLTQSLTFLVDQVGGLPEPVTNAGLAITVAGTALALTGGAALVAVPKFVAFKATLDATGISGRKAAIGIGAVGGALTVATLAIGYFIGEAAAAAATTDELTASLDQSTGALTNYSREVVKKKLADADAFSIATQLGISQKELTDAVLEGGAAFDEIESKLVGKNNVVDFFNGSGVAAGNATQTIRSLRGSVEQSQKDFADLAAAGGEVEESAEGVADQYVEVQEAIDGTITSVSDLVMEFAALNKAALDQRETARQLEAAYDDFDAAVEKNGKTLDITTEAGRENQAALDNIASSAQDAAQAILDNGGSVDDYRNSLKSSRKELLDRINDMGVHGQKAKDLRDEILAIPTKTDVEVQVRLDNLDEAKANMTDFVNTNFTIRPVVKPTAPSSISVDGRAAGGAIYGPGTGTSDDIPAWLSNGEHVLTAEEVRRAGGQGAVYSARRRLMDGGRLAFAKGGAVKKKKLAFEEIEVNPNEVERDRQLAERRAREQQRAAEAQAEEIDRIVEGMREAAEADKKAAEEKAQAEKDAAEALAQAAADLAEASKKIADEFSSIDLSGLTEETTSFRQVQNADGSLSLIGTTGKSNPTAEGINAFFADQSADNGRFAGKLAQLAGKIPVALLAYLTSLGVEKGEPYADALLAASDTTLASITTNYNNSQAGAKTIGGIVAPLLGHANGGAVFGPGSGTSDSIVRRLSNGEHVLSARDVDALGGQRGVYALREALYARPAQVAYAGGSGGTTVNYVTEYNTTQNYRVAATKSEQMNDLRAMAEVDL